MITAGYPTRRSRGSTLGTFVRSVRASIQLLRAADGRRLELVAALQVVSGVFAAGQLLVIRHLIAVVLTPNGVGDWSLAGPDFLLLALLGVGLSLGEVNQQRQQYVLSERVTHYCTQRILEAAASVELIEFEAPAFQDALRRAQFAVTRLFNVGQSATALIRNVALVVGTMTALIVVQPLLLAIALAGALPAWIASLRTSRTMYDFSYEMTPVERVRTYFATLLTNRDTAKEVRAYDLAEHFRSAHEKLSQQRLDRLEEHLDRRLRISTVGALTSGLIGVLGYIGLAYLLANHRIGFAEAAVAVVANAQLVTQLRALVFAISQTYESHLYVDDLREVLNRRVIVGQSPDEVGAMPQVGRETRSRERFESIELAHVEYSYPASDTRGPRATPSPQAVLRDVSLTIKRGEVIGLVADNGAGKTTLAKILAGLYRPRTGSYSWNGRNTEDLGQQWIAHHVAILFQDYARFMMTAGENVALGRVDRASDSSGIQHAAKLAGADEFIMRWPAGYETLLGPVFAGGREISTGEWQRLALARTVFRNADIVILDEPTASLDARAEAALFAGIRELFAGQSVLLISHRFSSMRSADRIYLLQDGAIAEHGTHDQLMRHAGRYAELFKLQAEAYHLS